MTHDPFAQVRQAHRICAAFYQQILPMINRAAQNVGTTFLVWDAWSFCKPPRRTVNPLETWAWDYLPMMDVSFVFATLQQPGSALTTADFVLDFKLVTDSELEAEHRVAHYGKEQEPLATQLKTAVESAKTYLNIYLFALISEGAYSAAEQMWKCYDGYPVTDGIVHLSKDKTIKSIGFSMPIVDIAHDDGVKVLVEKIEGLKGILVDLDANSEKPTVLAAE